MAGTIKSGPGGTVDSHGGVQALRDMVFEALNARVRENDYSIDGETDDEVAVDMCDCDSRFELMAPDQLVPHIRAWRAENAS